MHWVLILLCLLNGESPAPHWLDVLLFFLIRFLGVDFSKTAFIVDYRGARLSPPRSYQKDPITLVAFSSRNNLLHKVHDDKLKAIKVGLNEQLVRLCSGPEEFASDLMAPHGWPQHLQLPSNYDLDKFDCWRAAGSNISSSSCASGPPVLPPPHDRTLGAGGPAAASAAGSVRVPSPPKEPPQPELLPAAVAASVWVPPPPKEPPPPLQPAAAPVAASVWVPALPKFKEPPPGLQRPQPAYASVAASVPWPPPPPPPPKEPPPPELLQRRPPMPPPLPLRQQEQQQQHHRLLQQHLLAPAASAGLSGPAGPAPVSAADIGSPIDLPAGFMYPSCVQGVAPATEALTLRCTLKGGSALLSIPHDASWSASPVVIFLTGAEQSTVLSDTAKKGKPKNCSPMLRQTLRACIWITLLPFGSKPGKQWKLHPSTVSHDVVAAMCAVQNCLEQCGRSQSIHLVGFSRGGWWATYFASCSALPFTLSTVVTIAGYPSVTTGNIAEQEALAESLCGSAGTVLAIASTADTCSPATHSLAWYNTMEKNGGQVLILGEASHEQMYTHCLCGDPVLFAESSQQQLTLEVVAGILHKRLAVR